MRRPPRRAGATGCGGARVRGHLDAALARRGRPIAYGYLDRRYPLAAYQTVFARRPGSAEMASAGRPFTDALVTRLVVLRRPGRPDHPAHRGLLPGGGRGPRPGVVRGARHHGSARRGGPDRRRTGHRGGDHGHPGDRVGGGRRRPSTPSRGWTTRVVTPGDPPRVVDGLVTGWHDPHASHLLLVEAVAGRDLTQAAYDAAVARRLPLARVRGRGAPAAAARTGVVRDVSEGFPPRNMR